MRQFLCVFVALLALALAGCGGGSPVVGTWKLDITSLPNADKIPQATKDEIGKGRVTFNADKTMSSDDGKGTITKGTWELKDKTVTIKDDKTTTTATVTDDGKLQMDMMGTAVKFVKA